MTRFATLRPTLQRQRGSLVLGVIFGLVAGLLIALGVALYVTKMPVPFVDKIGTRRTPEQEAQEAERLRNWDPNAALAVGRAASQAATGNVASGAVMPASSVHAVTGAIQPLVSAASAAPVASAPPVALVASAVSKPVVRVASAPARAISPSGRDPAALLAGRDGASAKPDTRPPAGSTMYFVQAGAYSSETEAEQQRARLAMQGLDGARVLAREVNGRMVYRVRVGPFDAREDADKLKIKLGNGGIDAIVTPVPR